jgi:hypothetical protein
MRILHTHSAMELTVDISTKLRVASFRFVEGAGDVRVVTVSLPALGRLYRDIAASLLADPELFGSAVES